MTEYKILKYVIPEQDVYQLRIPKKSIILSVAEQYNKIVIYALVPALGLKDKINGDMMIEILIKGTGHLISSDINSYNFIGTVNLYNGQLMFHVFYKVCV